MSSRLVKMQLLLVITFHSYYVVTIVAGALAVVMPLYIAQQVCEEIR
jgi:hypothetical protein